MHVMQNDLKSSDDPNLKKPTFPFRKSSLEVVTKSSEPSSEYQFLLQIYVTTAEIV